MDNKNVDNKKQIVELFLNNEYIGVYSLGNTEKRVKKQDFKDFFNIRRKRNGGW